MYLILHKYSNPGWQKTFENDIDLREELVRHLCKLCIDGVRGQINEHGEIVYLETVICDVNDTESLLSTDCGCEYGVEEIYRDFE